MKDLVNEQASLDKEKLRISELRSAIGEKQRAIDLKKTYLSTEKIEYYQYYNFFYYSVLIKKLGI